MLSNLLKEPRFDLVVFTPKRFYGFSPQLLNACGYSGCKRNLLTDIIYSAQPNSFVISFKHPQERESSLMVMKPTYVELEQRVKKLEKADTKLNKAEKALAESEQRYQLLAESMSDVIWITDRNLRYTYVSPSVERFVGYTPEELIGRTIVDHLTPFSIETGINKFLEMLAGDIAEPRDPPKSSTMELQRIHKDGSCVWAEISFTFLRDEEGRPAGLHGITRDITDRKKAEEAMQEAEEQWRSMTENSPDLIMTIDPEGIVLFINRTLSLKKEEVINTSFFDYLTEESATAMKECLQRVLKGGGFDRCEVEQLWPDATSRIFEARVGPMFRSGQIVALTVSSTDITERNRMEEELDKLQRLELLGILAGGIAHDFNNLLTPILANISIAKTYGNLDPEIAEMLTDAEKASLRAKGLTQQLLTFAKGGAPIKKTISLSRLLKDTAKFALSGSSVSCEYSMPDDLWPVEVDEGQISQVIHNMVINADQVMAEGGIMKIRAENLTLGEKEHVNLKGDRHIKISIEDQGHGIPQEHLSKIFDPFFTIKEKGRGLGLATSLSIVTRHEGHIDVDSKMGVGTIFHIYLPASEKKPEIKLKDKPIKGEGKFLLIDDEENVRKSAREVLKRLGYQVQDAKDHAEGIKLYEKAMEGKHPFDAVIMDLTIPGSMGGKEAIKRIKRIDPEAKVIVSSGYSEDQAMSKFSEYGFCGVVAKPYAVEDLARVIHNVLKGVEE